MTEELDTSRPPIRYQPEVELIGTNEERLTREIVERMASGSRCAFEHHRHAIRDAHAKSHAVLKGELTIHEGIPPEFVQGIFAARGTHGVVARLSSAPSDIHSDEIPAPRGFALKVIDVAGERLSPAIGGANQDFLMVNFPTLAFGTIAKYQMLLGVLEANAHAPDIFQRIPSTRGSSVMRPDTLATLGRGSMKRTYRGSCHCKAVTFEADIDLAAGTGKCNCTVCWKQRMWTIGVTPADFRLLSGEDQLADYGRSGDWGEGHHRFCSVCGIHTHGHGKIAAMGGDPYVSVHLSALDDLPVDDLVGAPLAYMDGLHDNWWNPPSETRHL